MALSHLITLEGIDGSGKSTVAAALHRRAADEGVEVLLTAEPTPGPIGTLLRDQSGGPLPPVAEALLFVADRYDHQRQIQAALGAGTPVLCDRYELSTLAYQSVMLSGTLGDRDPLEWLRALHAGPLVRPTLTVLLQGPAPVLLQRAGRRQGTVRSRFERPDLLAAVATRYAELAAAMPEVVKVVDALQPLEEVTDRCWSLVRPLVRPR